MRDAALLGLRMTVGGYVAVHGAQKLFGAFDGPGLAKAGRAFERLGLRPGKAFAALGAGAETVGGILMAAGAADPVGPVMVSGAMAVASLTLADRGPMLEKGGFELPATYLAVAAALAGTGPGRYSVDGLIGLRLPKALVGATVVGTVALSTYSALRVVRAKQVVRADKERQAARAAETTPTPPA